MGWRYGERQIIRLCALNAGVRASTHIGWTGRGLASRSSPTSRLPMKSDPNPTVILAPRTTDDSITIWTECLRREWPASRLKSRNVPQACFRTRANCCSKRNLCSSRLWATQLGLMVIKPAADWLTTLPYYLTHRRIQVRSLKEAQALAQPTFVKPAVGKVFEARVYGKGAGLPSVS